MRTMTGAEVVALLDSPHINDALKERIANHDEMLEVHENGLVVDGELTVGPRSVVVLGDLIVSGSVTDTAKADYTLLVVVGNLEAKSVGSLAEIVVTGSLQADVVYGNSLFDYALTVGGDLVARAVINDGHHFAVSGAWKVRYQIAAHNSATLPTPTFDTSTLKSVLVASVLDSSEQGVELPAMFKALRAGSDVIRAKVTLPRAKSPVAAILAKATAKGSPKSLGLSRKELSELPIEVLALTSLQKLDVSNNALSSLPDDIGALDQLRQLDVRSNALTRLPASVTRMAKLTSLTAQYNKLTALPDDIGVLRNLGTLDVSSNQLRDLPLSLTKLTKLKSLHIGKQQPDGVNRLPGNSELIGELSQLDSLGLNDLGLTELPELVTRLKNLTWIDLSWNPLTTLPEAFFALTKLRYFKFNYTPTHPLVVEVLARIPGCQFAL